MTQPDLTIERFMTPSPHSISDDQTLAAASAMMNQHQIRHLPVMRGIELLGVVSSRDLKLVKALVKAVNIDPDQMPVGDAMTGEPFVVTPDTPVGKVAGTMAERKCSSSVVVKDRKIVGIFTSVDACRALAQLSTPAAG